MYTPGFAAPELSSKKELGPWTDIYSLGASMFTCMVGVPPQSAQERKKDDRMEGYFQQLEGMYSAEIINLMRWSLKLDPMLRPQSVFALQKALRNLSDNEHNRDGLLSLLRKMVS